MSESENLPTPPPPSTLKTSAVPLKKETVRINPRRGVEGSVQPREATAPVNPVTSTVPIAPPPASVMPKKATAPIQLPSAPLPPPAPKAASSPVKLPPPVAPSAPPPPGIPRAPGAPPPPAATVPMAPPSPPSAPPSAPRPPGAPPAPGAPKIETGAATSQIAKTVPLKPMPAAPRTPGAATGPMVTPGAPGSGALPKATVKLQQTQPMVRPSVSTPPSAPVKRGASEEQFYNEEKDPEEGLVPLSVVCFLLSAVLLVVQMFGSDRVKAENNSPIMVPMANNQLWEVQNPVDHKWENRFKVPEIPQ